MFDSRKIENPKKRDQFCLQNLSVHWVHNTEISTVGLELVFYAITVGSW